MHKRLLNEANIELTIEPDGPILIKSGAEGADPTRPDMEFVRTWHKGKRTTYLPGSSLKGVLRAHTERIVRSVLDENAACNPVEHKTNCSDRVAKAWNGKPKEEMKTLGEFAYSESCMICKLFGNTTLAGRLRTADAYPSDPEAVFTQQRDGVAIDRIFGSVAVGPFQMEVAMSGDFKTTIQIQNFTLAQLGLIALALRDIAHGRVGIGFGKSRGLGRVKATFESMSIRFPACAVDGGKLITLAGEEVGLATQLPGVGHFGITQGEKYGFPATDIAQLPDGITIQENDWLEPELLVHNQSVEAVWRQCIPAWREAINL